MSSFSQPLSPPPPGPPRRRFLTRLGPVLTAAGLVGLMAAGIALLQQRAEARDAAGSVPPAPLPVLTAPLKQEAGYHVEERFAGRLEPARETRLAFELAGRLTEVLVDEGQRVAAGTVLARLDDARLSAERDQFLAERREQNARLELARLNRTRVLRLAGSGHSSAEAQDEARLGVVQLEAAVARLDAAIQRLTIDLERCILTAPFAGTLADRFLDEGTVVSAGTPVLRLLEDTAREARIGVSATAATALVPGQSYALYLGQQALPARLLALAPDLTGDTRSVSARFALADAPPARFGETLELRLSRWLDAPGFWVPLGALTEAERGLWSVLLVVPDGAGRQIARVAVQVAHLQDERAFVQGSLPDGARLVSDGSHRVIPGQRVTLAGLPD
jgi:RND family efflux transporter MFP subunit